VQETYPQFDPVVIAPSYNNAGTLGSVLDQILDQKLPLIVVNDGATDGTAALLADRVEAVGDAELLSVETHEANQGKAAALQSGFKVAAARGFTHALTIDTDGQHDPKDMHDLLDAARQHPAALIIGTRSEKIDGYPAKSLIGRRISNMLIWLESGARVEDSQSGYRVYPIALTQTLQCRAGFYGYETEVLTRAAWIGCDLIAVPIPSCYLPDDQRVSHLNPWKDSLRAVGMHLRLLALTMLPWKRGKNWPHDPTPDEKTTRPWWKRAWDWISPAEAWRQMRRSRVDQNRLSTGVAVGVFIANLPAFPFQTIIGLYTARRLHLHPISVLFGTYISTPPIGVLLVGLAIGVGHFLLHGQFPSFGELQVQTLNAETVSKLFGSLLLEWIVGSLILGSILAPISYVAMKVFFKCVPVKEIELEPSEDEPLETGTQQPGGQTLESTSE